MVDTNVSDAVVFPEDDGTGVSDGSEDYDSAGHFGLLSQHQGGSYVGNGLGFSNVDTNNNTVDVGSGHAFIEFDSVTVQSGSGSTYDTTLPDPIVMTVVLPTSVTVNLDDGAENDVYLATDPTTNDGAYVRHGSTVSAPSDPSVLLGTVDTTDSGATRANDNASPTYDDVTANSVDVDDLLVNNGLVAGEEIGSDSAASSSISVSVSSPASYRQLVVHIPFISVSNSTSRLSFGSTDYQTILYDGTTDASTSGFEIITTSDTMFCSGAIVLTRQTSEDKWTIESSVMPSQSLSRFTSAGDGGWSQGGISSAITVSGLDGSQTNEMVVFGVR